MNASRDAKILSCIQTIVFDVSCREFLHGFFVRFCFKFFGEITDKADKVNISAAYVMKSKNIATFCLFALPCIFMSGCLSLQLGGKTHNCNGSMEMSAANARIAYLENRINALEHYAGITPTPQSPVSIVSHTTERGGVRVKTVETIPTFSDGNRR